MQGGVFSQPFTHFFGSTTAAFGGFGFPLDAKDIILFLVLLLCLFKAVHLAFRDRVRLPWVATPKSAPETRDAA